MINESLVQHIKTGDMIRWRYSNKTQDYVNYEIVEGQYDNCLITKSHYLIISINYPNIWFFSIIDQNIGRIDLENHIGYYRNYHVVPELYVNV